MINLENLVAASGLPGLHRIAANRSNGLIVEDIDTGKKKFLSVRKHAFTPLETIGIYTYTDTAALGDVFAAMKTQMENNPVISPKSPAYELEDYFRSILNDFDEDRVKPKDISKIIKWFNFLRERDMLIESKTDDRSEEE